MNHTPPIFIHSTGHIAHRPRILIVDDVLTNVQYLLDALKEDYQVNFELSGRQELNSHINTGQI